MFGSVGAVIVVATIMSTIVLTVRVRDRERQVFRLTALAAALFALALVLWWAIVFPANQELATWVGGHAPSDWARVRARWETGHAINTLLQFVGFVALVLSVVRETPENDHAAR